MLLVVIVWPLRRIDVDRYERSPCTERKRLLGGTCAWSYIAGPVAASDTNKGQTKGKRVSGGYTSILNRQDGIVNPTLYLWQCVLKTRRGILFFRRAGVTVRLYSCDSSLVLQFVIIIISFKQVQEHCFTCGVGRIETSYGA